mgnify:CR=1 FL=1
MSFVDEEDIWSMTEGLMKEIFKDIKGIELPEFKRIPYDTCMERYGSDKPDLRYGMKMVDVADIFARSTNEIFSSIACDTKSNRIKALVVKQGDRYFSKTQMKNFESFVRGH